MYNPLTQEDADKFKKSLKKITKELCKDPKAAKEFLINSGIYLPSGEIHPNYGGKSEDFQEGFNLGVKKTLEYLYEDMTEEEIQSMIESLNGH